MLQTSASGEGCAQMGCGIGMMLIPLGITQVIGIFIIFSGFFRFLYGLITDSSSAISSKSLRDPSVSSGIPSYELKGICPYRSDTLVIMMSSKDNKIVKKQACKTCSQETLVKENKFYKVMK